MPTRRQLFRPVAHHSVSRFFANIDAIDIWRARFFSARPSATLAPTLIAALPRFRLAKSYSHRDENAVMVLGNAIRVEKMTRSRWKIGANTGDASLQLSALCQPGDQHRTNMPNTSAMISYRVRPLHTKLCCPTAGSASPRRETSIDLDSYEWGQPDAMRKSH